MQNPVQSPRITAWTLALLLLPSAFAGSAHAAPRDASQWPFSVDSPWNTPMGSGAAFDNSACNAGITDTTVGNDVNAGSWSHPVVVAGSGDAYNTIKRRGVGNVANIRIPAAAKPATPSYASGGDAHLHVIDPSKRYVDEMWQAQRQSLLGSNTVTVSSYTRNDLYGPGIGTGGERAYGGSAIGGLIRTAELNAKNIPHALAFALPRSSQAYGPVWPATLQDDGADTTYRGAVHMGTLVAIPAAVDITKLGLSPQGLVVARALQDYGAYDVDSSGDFALYAEPSAESLVGAIRTDLPKIRAQLRCVSNNGPSTVGGGGVRRAPLAPPLP